MHLILGSQSQRRKEILELFPSLEFLQVASNFDEGSVCFKGKPESYVEAISLGKAKALGLKFPERLVLTADTVVFQNGKVFGKPKDEKEGFDMLSNFSGKWHQVYTGLTLQKGNKTFSQVEVTNVLFHHLNSDQIEFYLANKKWRDKSGGYTIQAEGGGLFVKKIEGCFYNVMGLPLNTLSMGLKEFGIELWKCF